MDKVNFHQNRPRHVSESYALPECTNKSGYAGTFCME